jgi:hypothetical protein
MKRLETLAVISLLWCLTGQAQNVSNSDSLKVMEAVDMTFKLFESPNAEQFKKSSTDRIYCMLCFMEPDPNSSEPYMIGQDEFFENHLLSLKDLEAFKRATKSEDIFLNPENNDYSDITFYMTTWQRDEWQEGSSLGFYFKRSGNRFIFAGIEIIP